VGYVSTVVNRHLSDGVRHVSVEANERLIPVLEDTRRLNDADFEVVNGVYKVGVDSHEFHLASNCFSSSTVHRDDTDIETTREVPAVTLAGLREKFDVGTFQLVADVEGAEFEMITEERELLEQYCRLLVVEFYDHGEGDVDDAIEDLRASGFDVVDSVGNVYVLRQ
jgi:FkbM family methyltransferase